jgi:hypothetical protein
MEGRDAGPGQSDTPVLVRLVERHLLQCGVVKRVKKGALA